MQRAERRAGLAARGGFAMRQTKSSLWTAGLLLALVVGCTAPAGDVRPGVPADLMIAVEIDGKAVAPIDAARLDALAPDYVDEHRRAWRLGALLDVGEPFPGFHGRGGNRGRAGDPDRIRDVTHIRLSAAQAR